VPRLWRQIIKGEEGQALPVVLILLVVGGLIIAPTLNHVSTSLNAGRIVEENVKGIYAAEAGVEDALWKLINDSPPSSPYYLPEPVVNQMDVEIETEDKGTYTLYFGELQEIEIPQQNHYDWLAVDGEMVWDEPADAYKYTITATWQPYPGEPDIKLEDVGVRLPVGYSYQPGSAAVFSEDNLSVGEPGDLDATDWAGAQMLSWGLGPPPLPMITIDNQTATQTFYVTGEGEREGDYTWVKNPAGLQIGEVGEVIGTLYSITANATHPGDDEVIARVRADVILYEETEEISIMLWQINPEEE
jgi:hypothetical protein